jgi:UPF0716 family protein affecting phage T7 exclusion
VEVEVVMSFFYYAIIALLLFVVVAATIAGSWLVLVLSAPILLAFTLARPEEL